jgi:ribosomal protein S18 acetylase RimI-like enzyme
MLARNPLSDKSRFSTGAATMTRDSLIIRPAGRDDVPAVVGLLAADPLGARREQCEQPLPQVYWDAFAAVQDSPDNDLLVADLEGKVVGCLQLTLIPGLSRRGMRRAQIEAVRVDGSVRGRRIGERLMQDAIERARAAGCRLVQLTSDASRTDAHRFYQRLGFEPSHVGYKLRLD